MAWHFFLILSLDMAQSNNLQMVYSSHSSLRTESKSASSSENAMQQQFRVMAVIALRS